MLLKTTKSKERVGAAVNGSYDHVLLEVESPFFMDACRIILTASEARQLATKLNELADRIV